MPGAIGTKEDDLKGVEFDNKIAEEKLFTGLTEQSVNSASDYTKSVIYKHTNPFPFMCLMLITKLDPGEE